MKNLWIGNGDRYFMLFSLEKFQYYTRNKNLFMFARINPVRILYTNLLHLCFTRLVRQIIPLSVSVAHKRGICKSSPRPSLIPYLNLIRSQEIHRQWSKSAHGLSLRVVAKKLKQKIIIQLDFLNALEPKAKNRKNYALNQSELARQSFNKFNLNLI